MLFVRSPWSRSNGQWTNNNITATAPQTGPASRLPIANTYKNATPPNNASQNRRPNSSCGSSPARIGAATIQNFSGGFSRKTAVSLGLLLGCSQSPISRMRSTAKE